MGCHPPLWTLDNLVENGIPVRGLYKFLLSWLGKLSVFSFELLFLCICLSFVLLGYLMLMEKSMIYLGQESQYFSLFFLGGVNFHDIFLLLKHQTGHLFLFFFFFPNFALELWLTIRTFPLFHDCEETYLFPSNKHMVLHFDFWCYTLTLIHMDLIELFYKVKWVLMFSCQVGQRFLNDAI